MTTPPTTPPTIGPTSVKRLVEVEEIAEDEVAGVEELDAEVRSFVVVAPGTEHMSKLYQAHDALWH